MALYGTFAFAPVAIKKKASSSTLAGALPKKVIEERVEISAKAFLEIVVTELGIFRVVRRVPPNALSPMVVTELPIVTEVSVVTLSKDDSPIVVTESGIIKLVMRLPPNAESPIVLN